MNKAKKACMINRRRSLKPSVLGLLLFLVLCGCSTARQEKSFSPKVRLTSLRGFPQGEDGYSLGVSACYAGIIGNRLIMAGGCNFPEKGKKRYYSGIYAARLGEDSLRWTLVGRLPRAAAYGASVVSGDSLILIGGCNNEERLSSVLSLKFTADSSAVVVRSMTSLPATMDNGTAALADGTVYVAGGNQDGKPSRAIWGFDLCKEKTWKSLVVMPLHARVQPVSACSEGRLYVWGGFSTGEAEPVVATNGLSYDLQLGQLARLDGPSGERGESLTLSGGCAVAMTTSHNRPYILAMGGVNKDIFLDAISNRYQLVAQKDYLDQTPAWYRFNRKLLCYDVRRQTWLAPLLDDERLARAGATAVVRGHTVYYIGGELKPGVRVAAIVSLSVDD